ncbi:hypothetical protein ASJ79_05455 [Mycobacterium sp. NAZ190054]|nr:hypothetical protein ASJ79_05455 [Mycobacterium sp. NAZ190054]
MRAIIAAHNIARAMQLSCELGFDKRPVALISPRAIKQGAGRGLTADIVLIDDQVDLGADGIETLRSTLIGSGGQMYRLSRVEN